MKLALMVPGGVGRDGTHQVIPCLLWLIEELAGRGHEVHVFVPRQEARRGDWPLLGATVHNAGGRMWRARTLAAMLAEHLRSRFHAIHALWAEQGELGAIAARLLRVPMVLTLAGGEAARLPGIGYGGRLTWRGRLQLRLAAEAAERLTVPSAFMRDLVRPLGVEAAVVPLGVSLARWPPAPVRPREGSAPLKLLQVADLNPVKDQRTLLKAAVLLKRRGVRFELRVCGFDTRLGGIQRMARRLGLQDEVRFFDPVPHSQVRAQFEWADVLVVSSRHEAGPLVMLEAALAGVPTVGTRVGHIADLAPEGAVAVPVGNAPALADAITLIAADEAQRRRVAAAAQAFALHHDTAFTTRAFEQIYREAAGQTQI